MSNVRGRKYTDISGYIGSAAEPAKLPILKNVKKLGLQRSTHLAKFVQQESAIVGLFEFSGFPSDCSGKRTGLVTE